MSTFVVKQDGTEDYTTLQSALDANVGTYVFQIRSGGNVSTGILAAGHAGSTIEAYAGEEADPIAYSAGGSRTDYAYLYSGSATETLDIGAANNITVKGLWVRNARHGYAYAIECGTSGYTGGLIHRCVLEMNGGGFFTAYLRGSGVFRNNVCFITSTTATSITGCVSSWGWDCYNNSIRSNGTGHGGFYMRSYVSKFRNNVCCVPTANAGNDNDGWHDYFTPATMHNNIGDGGSLAAAAASCGDASGNQDNKSEATVLTNAASWDFTPVAGGPADGTGENLTATFTDDFYGNPRPAVGAWTIGAFQLAAAGGPFPHYTRRRMQGGMTPMGIG